MTLSLDIGVIVEMYLRTVEMCSLKCIMLLATIIIVGWKWEITCHFAWRGLHTTYRPPPRRLRQRVKIGGGTYMRFDAEPLTRKQKKEKEREKEKEKEKRH